MSTSRWRGLVSGVLTSEHVVRISLQPALKRSPMYIPRALALLFLTQTVLARQPTPILPVPKLTPGDTFDVTDQDVCVPGYAKKVRAVPAWLKRTGVCRVRNHACRAAFSPALARIAGTVLARWSVGGTRAVLASTHALFWGNAGACYRSGSTTS